MAAEIGVCSCEGRSSPAIRDHRVFGVGAVGNAVRLVASDIIRWKAEGKTGGSQTRASGHPNFLTGRKHNAQTPSAPVNCYPDSSLQYGLHTSSSGILPRATGNEEDVFGLQPEIFITAIKNFFDGDRNALAGALDLANDLGPIQSRHWTIPTGER